MYTHTPLVKNGRRSNDEIQVVLGSHTVKAFVIAPKEYTVIGIVKLGLEYGLLALRDTGEYVRVNGSLVQALNQTEVEDAVALARISGRGESYAHTRACSRCEPKVAFRKHRKIDRSLIGVHE